MSWNEKFRPNRIREIVGQDNAIVALKECIMQRKPAILHGPTGTGKTSSVYAIAHEYGYDLVEVNASDIRNKKNMDGFMKNALMQESLISKNKIILIDEIDSLSGVKDRGGASAIVSAIKESNFPVVFTANNPYESKIRSLRTKSKLIEYKKVHYLEIQKKLKYILDSLGIEYTEDVLKTIALRSGGDVRGAINDLEVLSSNFDHLEGIGERENTETIFNILKLVFKSNEAKNVLGILMNSDINLDEFWLWLDENLPREYRGKDLIEAYDKLSRADVFYGRIRKWQYWRYLVYVDALLTAGVTASKGKKEAGFVSYKRGGRILKMWIMNRKNAMRKEISKKLAKKIHMSSGRVTKEVLPYLRIIVKNKKGIDVGLTKDEVNYLNEN